MKESLVIRFLYNTCFGRILLKLLVHPKVSRASAYFFSSSLSRFLVPLFILKNHINMNFYFVPKEGYQSFNDFFIRIKKEKIRTHGELVSPCDGLLTISDINEQSVFFIKHTSYSLSELLKSEKLANAYQGGTAFIFRLTPAHYHRYIWATSGVLCAKRHIPGILHSVQPICHEKEKVFVQNTREYTILKNKQFGMVLQMEIGALLVGKISNYPVKKQQTVLVGQEKGFFEYGGSSIVILVKKGVMLAPNMRKSEYVGNEISVSIGEKLVM